MSNFQMKHYDYIFTGAGLSALMTVYKMVQSGKFKDKSILLLDENTKKTNDRTWCFWKTNDSVWEKSISTGFLNANRMPLRAHEIVLVFYRKLPTYNPIKHFLSTPSYKKGNKARSSSNYGKFTHDMDLGHKDGSRYPRSVFNVPYENSFFDSTSKTVQKMIHPTQKPIGLPQYIIKTYSNPGDTVFDGFSGSGSTAMACINEGRKFIGSELNKEYFDKAFQRISIELSKPQLVFP